MAGGLVWNWRRWLAMSSAKVAAVVRDFVAQLERHLRAEVIQMAETPERLAASMVTLDENGGVPSIVASHLEVTARVPGLDLIDSDAETGETSWLILATAVWIGGLIVIFVVARVARATLGTAERVRLSPHSE